VQQQMLELEDAAQVSLANEAKIRAALWNEQAQTERIAKLEAAITRLAPHDAVFQLNDVIAQAADVDARLATVEESVAAREAAAREALLTSQAEQDHELGRRTEHRLKQAEEAIDLKIAEVRTRLDSLTHVAETGRATAEAALRLAKEEAKDLRAALCEREQELRKEAHDSYDHALRACKDDLVMLRDSLESDMEGLKRDSRAMLGELKFKYGSCWEGVRENRSELGDVMQTLHHLVERSEIQHVVNQMVSRTPRHLIASWSPYQKTPQASTLDRD
jgi:hypothetical protein